MLFRSYDVVNGWGGSHPIQGVPIFVLSKDVPDKVPKGASTFTFVADGLISIVSKPRPRLAARTMCWAAQT